MGRWRWEQVNDWLDELGDVRKGAEIGVKEGRCLSFLLGHNPMLTMYAVDPWENQPQGNETYQSWDWNNIRGEYLLRTSAYRGRIIELREYSVTAAEKVEDGSLDFVFIDAQHDYESVKEDIALWLPKVRAGGLISGHDYEPNFPGVIQAVDEAFENVITGSNATWAKWV